MWGKIGLVAVPIGRQHLHALARQAGGKTNHSAM
jgi:hypothetical protein